MRHPEAELAVFYYDLAVREIERVKHGRVRVVIVHRYGHAASPSGSAALCVSGEEVQSAWIVFRGKSVQLLLSSPHLILWDYLCRHCRGSGQHAAEIEAGLREKLWYVHHGSLAKRRGVILARSSRTAIRKQIERIRKVLDHLFLEEHLPLHSEQILCSRQTSTRQVRYFIRADVVIEH